MAGVEFEGLGVAVRWQSGAGWRGTVHSVRKVQRNSTVVENDYMYGAQETFYDSDKDAYNTKIVDNDDIMMINWYDTEFFFVDWFS